MRSLLGILIVIFGVCFGLYVGIRWAFIGGIVDVIDGIKATPTEAMTIAIGVAKFFFSGIIGWVSGIFIVGAGVAMLK